MSGSFPKLWFEVGGVVHKIPKLLLHYLFIFRWLVHLSRSLQHEIWPEGTDNQQEIQTDGQTNIEILRIHVRLDCKLPQNTYQEEEKRA